MGREQDSSAVTTSASVQLPGFATASADPRTADGVYRELLNRLVTRAIEPGAKISIDGLSRELGVSQTPIREALVRLESERLVTRVHMSGFSAAPLLSEDEFEKVFEMRLLAEPFLAGLAATRHVDDQAELMAKAAERMRQLGERIGLPTYGEFASEDASLHDLIACAADSPPLRMSLLHLHSHIHLFRLHYDARVPLDALNEHDDVLSAIVERRPTAASAAMREHLRASRARLSQAFRH